MAETTSTKQSSASGSTDTSNETPSTRSGSGAQLESGRGVTTIQDSVVAKISGIAAREVGGVADLGGAASSAIGGVMGRLRGQEHSTAGVGVEVGERQAAIDIALQVEYPARIHEVASSVRENVIDRIETMTGLEVVEVNVAVLDLAFPGGEEEDASKPQRVE
ncbi:Asp23/Gls24 family envelope stress response protein [soil metagenome]